MSWKVVKDENGKAICFGPNHDGYQPVVPQGHTLEVVETEPALAPVAADVNAERNRRLALPKTVTVGVRTFALDMAGGGRQNISDASQLAMVKKAAGDTSAFVFRDAANVDQTLTNDEMISVAVQIAAQVNALYKASWSIKNGGDIPADYADDERWS
jgi:hypothetical protein